MTTTAETPDRVLARKVSSRVVQMNSKAAEFESLIFLVVEHFAAQALHQAQNDKLEEAATWLDNRAEFYEARSAEAIDVYHAAERMFGSEACAYAAGHIRSLKSKDTP